MMNIIDGRSFPRQTDTPAAHVKKALPKENYPSRAEGRCLQNETVLSCSAAYFRATITNKSKAVDGALAFLSILLLVVVPTTAPEE